MDVSYDDTLLAVGFFNGEIDLIELEHKIVIKTIKGVH